MLQNSWHLTCTLIWLVVSNIIPKISMTSQTGHICEHRFPTIPNETLRNVYYKSHQITKLKWFSSRLAVWFAQFLEARCSSENEDVVVGAAPTTSQWSKILLPTTVRLIWEIDGTLSLSVVAKEDADSGATRKVSYKRIFYSLCVIHFLTIK